jgi:hypothetical protein
MNYGVERADEIHGDSYFAVWKKQNRKLFCISVAENDGSSGVVLLNAETMAWICNFKVGTMKRYLSKYKFFEVRKRMKQAIVEKKFGPKTGPTRLYVTSVLSSIVNSWVGRIASTNKVQKDRTVINVTFLEMVCSRAKELGLTFKLLRHDQGIRFNATHNTHIDTRFFKRRECDDSVDTTIVSVLHNCCYYNVNKPCPRTVREARSVVVGGEDGGYNTTERSDSATVECTPPPPPSPTSAFDDNSDEEYDPNSGYSDSSLHEGDEVVVEENEELDLQRAPNMLARELHERQVKRPRYEDFVPLETSQWGGFLIRLKDFVDTRTEEERDEIRKNIQTIFETRFWLESIYAQYIVPCLQFGNEKAEWRFDILHDIVNNMFSRLTTVHNPNGENGFEHERCHACNRTLKSTATDRKYLELDPPPGGSGHSNTQRTYPLGPSCGERIGMFINVVDTYRTIFIVPYEREHVLSLCWSLYAQLNNLVHERTRLRCV